MSLRASLSVVLGLNFNSAGKLLKGADRSNTRDVKEVRLQVEICWTRSSAD